MKDKKISKLVADSAAFIRNAQMQVAEDGFRTMFLSRMLLVTCCLTVKYFAIVGYR